MEIRFHTDTHAHTHQTANTKQKMVSNSKNQEANNSQPNDDDEENIEKHHRNYQTKHILSALWLIVKRKSKKKKIK